MSDVVSPDAATTGTEDAQSGGKVSLMDKVKTKAKIGTKKLKSKLNKGNDSGSTTGAAEKEDDTSSASSSDEEQEAPVKNAMSGMTQPEYGKKLEEGDPSVLAGGATGATEGSPSVPHTNFPGDYEGAVGEKETELSKDFEGLSTQEKGSAPESGSTDDKPVTEKATETLSGAKGQVEEKIGSDKPSGGESVTDSLPEQVKPTEETKQAAAGYYEKASGAATDYYNIAAEKASQLTGKTQETAKDATESGSTGEVADKAADAGKTWSQWAAEKVGYGKDVAAEKLPTTEDGTSAPDAAIGKATEAKDVISQKTGEVADTASAKADEAST